jgi:hypothetical protein
MLDVSKLFAHDHIRRIRVLKSVRNRLIAKQLIHLLKRTALRLREEGPITNCGNQVPREEEVEEAESQVLQSDGCALGKDQIERPVGEGG